jgi:hypothetical protein
MVDEVTDANYQDETKDGVVLTDFLGNMVWSMSYAITCN